MITRRKFMIQSGVVAGAALFAQRSVATVSGSGVEITSLSDGHLMLPRNFLIPETVDASEVDPILRAHGLTGDTLTPACNITLMRDGSNVVLFDAGSGSGFMSSAGKLPSALEALGVAADEVTHVVFTHAHPDHLWGVLDDFDDPLFYNARYIMGGAEHGYWSDPATAETIGAERASFAVGAARRLEAIADQLTLIEAGDAPLPGVRALATPGHTPGHMSYWVESGTGEMLVIGDAIGNDHLAFARPDLPSGSDQDQALGIETRLALLHDLATQNAAVIGFHFAEGGMGRVARSDDAAYRFDLSA